MEGVAKAEVDPVIAVMDLVCEICGLEPAIGVASSPYAPCSLAYGQNCVDRNADALWILTATLEICGGCQGIRKEFYNAMTFKDGNYCTIGKVFLMAKTMDVI